MLSTKVLSNLRFYLNCVPYAHVDWCWSFCFGFLLHVQVCTYSHIDEIGVSAYIRKNITHTHMPQYVLIDTHMDKKGVSAQVSLLRLCAYTHIPEVFSTRKHRKTQRIHANFRFWSFCVRTQKKSMLPF